MSEKVLVSVIVVTAGQRPTLKQCLNSILTQSCKNFELIVVNDGGSAGGLQAVANSLDRGGGRRLKLLHHKERKGIAAARNTGIRSAEGEYCVFLDDDAFALDGYLVNILRPYKNLEVGGVGSLIVSPRGNAVTEGIAVKHYFRMDEKYRHAAGEVDSLRGTSMSFRTRILRELGGFDELLGKSVFLDDAEMSLAVRRRGYKLFYEPSAVVVHHGAPQGGCKPGMLWWGYYWIRARLYVMLKHYRFFGNPLSVPLLLAYGFRKYVRRCRANSASPITVLLGLSAFAFGIPAAFKLRVVCSLRRRAFV